MPSLQAQSVSTLIKIFLRRRSWGRDEFELARRARRKFGSPKILQWLKTHGLQVEIVKDENVWGEWIVPPEAEEKTIFYIHGGGYVACSAATHRPITTALARLGRFRVFSVNYRRAPEHRFPAALNDTFAAYRWLLEQGFNPKNVALVGDSAGGGLVLSTLLRARDEGVPLPACAVCYSPWTDMTGSGESGQTNQGRCALFHPENINLFRTAYLGDASPLEPLASQIFAELHGLPPLLLQVGSTELLLDDSRRIHEKILAAGGISRLEIFEDVSHCWQMLDGIVPEARAALRQTADFIDDHL
jgi:acetyl esterase/lipase